MIKYCCHWHWSPCVPQDRNQEPRQRNFRRNVIRLVLEPKGGGTGDMGPGRGPACLLLKRGSAAVQGGPRVSHLQARPLPLPVVLSLRSWPELWGERAGAARGGPRTVGWQSGLDRLHAVRSFSVCKGAGS